MSYFRVMLHGEGISIKQENQSAVKLTPVASSSSHVGFYTTRIVEAKDEADAVEQAVKLTLKELQSISLDPESALNSPRFSTELVTKLNFWQFLRARPRKGFTFYSEPNDA